MAGGVWLTTADGTFTTDANWSSGTHPGSNDDTQFLDGSVTLNGIDESSTDLDSIFVGPDFEGGIGSSGTYLQLGCDLCSLMAGPKTQNLYLKADSAAFDDVRIDSDPNCEIYLDAASGGVTALTVVRGHVHLVQGTFTTVNITWDGVGHKPFVWVETATITTLNQFTDCNINMTGAGTITTANVDGGLLDVDAGTVTTYNQRGGRVLHETTSTVTTLNAYGGLFDGSRDGRAKTFTTINKHKNSTVNLNVGIAGAITISNNNLFFGDPVQVI